jgi:hypothetical protein
LSELSKSRQPFPTGTPTHLTVVSWPDPVVETRRHRPGSPYVEFVWPGVLGPSTTLCWSRLSRIASAQPHATVDVTDLATSLGLSAQLGRNAAITRTLSRMVMFGTAARSEGSLALLRALSDFPERMVARLPSMAQVAHRRWGSLGMFGTAKEQNLATGVSASLEVGL